MDKVRVGILGLGGAGRAHAQRFRKNKFVGEILTYDQKPVELHGVRACASVQEVLDHVDVVSICTPDDTHLENIKVCMTAGKHVLVEKPMVSSHVEAIALGKILEDHRDLKFAVHHQMRYVPAFQKAKALIDKGALGKVFYVEANYWHDMRLRNSQFDDWRLRGTGQSVIFGGACHPLDLLMHLVDGGPVDHETYLSKNGYPDYSGLYTSATTILRFPDGVVGKCHTNNCVVFPQTNNLIVLGDKGSFIDGVLYANGGFEVASRFHDDSEPVSLLERLTVGLPSIVTLALLRRMRQFRTNPLSIYNHERACQLIVDNFIDAVTRNERVLVGYDEGCRVIGLCEDTEADGLLRSNACLGGRAVKGA